MSYNRRIRRPFNRPAERSDALERERKRREFNTKAQKLLRHGILPHYLGPRVFAILTTTLRDVEEASVSYKQAASILQLIRRRQVDSARPVIEARLNELHKLLRYLDKKTKGSKRAKTHHRKHGQAAATDDAIAAAQAMMENCQLDDIEEPGPNVSAVAETQHMMGVCRPGYSDEVAMASKYLDQVAQDPAVARKS